MNGHSSSVGTGTCDRRLGRAEGDGGADTASDSEVTVRIETVRIGDRRTYGVTVAEGDVYARSATACVRLAPAVTADGVYVPGRNALVKFDPESSEERWRVPVDHSGEVRWRRDLHSRGAAALAANGDVYVVAGDLHELDPGTGDDLAGPPPKRGHGRPGRDRRRRARRDWRCPRLPQGDRGLLGPDHEHWRMSSVHAAEYSSPVIAAGRAFVAGPAGMLALTVRDTALSIGVSQGSDR